MICEVEDFSEVDTKQVAQVGLLPAGEEDRVGAKVLEALTLSPAVVDEVK